jgi:hypothetical protein
MIEDEEFEPPPPVVATTSTPSKWEDEDKEEQEAPEAWDKEDEEEEEQSSKPKEPKKIKPKKPAKKSAANKIKPPPEEEGLVDPIIEKIRAQQRVEEADFQNTKEMFSGLDSVSVVNTSDPKDEKDFEVLAESLAKKLSIYEVLDSLVIDLMFEREATITKDS